MVCFPLLRLIGSNANRLRVHFNLTFLVLALLILVGGPLLVLAIWYSLGRDPEVGIVADYLPEPPSNLPPGVAGTLIDERADMKDIVATIVDLARRGLHHYSGRKERSSVHQNRKSGRKFALLRKTIAHTSIRQENGEKLSDLRYKFSNALPSLRSSLYEELEKEGLVPVSPQTIRTRFGCLTGLAVVVGFLLFLIPSMLTDVGLAVCIGIGFVPTIIALAVASRHMPRKTELGALEAAKWEAFKNYLMDIERYTDLKEATDIFDTYLPYAIALDWNTVGSVSFRVWRRRRFRRGTVRLAILGRFIIWAAVRARLRRQPVGRHVNAHVGRYVAKHDRWPGRHVQRVDAGCSIRLQPCCKAPVRRAVVQVGVVFQAGLVASPAVARAVLAKSQFSPA